MKHKPNRKPNYLKALVTLARKMAPGTITTVNVAHDPWCSVWRGGTCNCQPALTSKAARDVRSN